MTGHNRTGQFHSTYNSTETITFVGALNPGWSRGDRELMTIKSSRNNKIHKT